MILMIFQELKTYIDLSGYKIEKKKNFKCMPKNCQSEMTVNWEFSKRLSIALDVSVFNRGHSTYFKTTSALSQMPILATIERKQAVSPLAAKWTVTPRTF